MLFVFSQLQKSQLHSKSPSGNADKGKSMKRAVIILVILLFVILAASTAAQDITPVPPTETPMIASPTVEGPTLIPATATLELPTATPIVPMATLTAELPILTLYPTDTPTELPTLTALPSATSTPTSTATGTETPTDLPTATPTLTPSMVPTSGFFPDEPPPAAAPFSRFADRDDYALVAAGDLTALYAAIDAVNAGLISVIYLNADGQRTDPAADRTYWLTTRLRFERNVVIYGNGAILRQTPVTTSPIFPRVLYVPPAVTVEMQYVELTGVDLTVYETPFSRYGGAVRNDGALRLIDSVVQDNAAGEGGGGIMNIGVLWLERTTIAVNRAGGGAGVQNDAGGGIVATCSRFINNFGGYGVGILNGNVSNDSSQITVNRSLFTNNITVQDGLQQDIFNLLGGIATVNASGNYWGSDGIPQVDDGQGGSSIDTSSILMEDPTVPNGTGSYTYLECAPAPDQPIPTFCVVAGPQCSPQFQPPQLSLSLDVDFARLTPDQLANPYTFTIGEQIPLLAQVSAVDVRDIPETVRIELTVPRGLRPQGMTIQGEDQSVLNVLLSLLITLLDLINPDLSGLVNDILGIDVTSETVTFAYDYDGGLIVGGQPFPITLEVVGKVPGTFTITGEASVMAGTLSAASAVNPAMSIGEAFTTFAEAFTQNASVQIQVDALSNVADCDSIEQIPLVEQLETTYRFIIDESGLIDESEVRASCRAVINTANALQMFADVASGGPTYESSADAFINILLGNPDASITYSNTTDTTLVGASNCKTGPTTIVCGAQNVLSEYTMTHEFGHVFLYRTATGIRVTGTTVAPCPLATGGVGFIGCMDDPNLSNSNPNNSAARALRGANSQTQFVFGVITRRWRASEIQRLIANFDPTGQYGISSSNFQLTICEDFSSPPCGENNDEDPVFAEITDWERGVTGWDIPIEVNVPGRFGACANASGDYEFNDFQQNPCVIYEWVLEHPAAVNVGNVGTLKTTEQEEAGADMFLNWVYRTVEGATSQAFGDNNDVPTGRPFPECIVEIQGHGDDRFCWMQENLRPFFQYYGW